MKKQKAFTLIELLVVIAIIALLLSILMPALRKVKKQAQVVVCSSNLHQWGIMWRMCVDDNDGKFNGEDFDNNPGWIRGQWATLLRSYWKDQGRQKLLTCPSAKKPQSGYIPGSPGTRNWGGPGNTYQVSGDPLPDGTYEIASYGMNLWAFNRPGSGSVQGRPNELHWGKLDVKGAERIPLFLDSMWRGGGPHYLDFRAGTPPEFNGQWGDAAALGQDFPRGVTYEMQHFCIDRHNKKINGVFFDLATQKIPLKKLWKLKWHRTFDTRGYTENGRTWPDWMRSFSE